MVCCFEGTIKYLIDRSKELQGFERFKRIRQDSIIAFKNDQSNMARWLSRLERRPVTAEVVGSIPSRVVLSKYFMDGFPSGQRGQTVNLLSVTSVVRIHPHPFETRYEFHSCYFQLKWGLSSAGRASALQAGGHRFEPCRPHLFCPQS